MTRFEDHYARAVHSGDMRSRPETTFSDSDVCGAAGLASRRRPLAMALLRLFMADNGGAAEVVALLAGMAVSKAYHAGGDQLGATEAQDIARAVLAWHRDGVCRACGGHGFELAGNAELGEGRAALGDTACRACSGTRKVPFERQFRAEQVWLAQWLRAEIEREQAFAGTEAMRSLGSLMDLA